MVAVVLVFGDFGGLLHVVISVWQSFDVLQLAFGKTA